MTGSETDDRRHQRRRRRRDGLREARGCPRGLLRCGSVRLAAGSVRIDEGDRQTTNRAIQLTMTHTTHDRQGTLATEGSYE